MADSRGVGAHCPHGPSRADGDARAAAVRSGLREGGGSEGERRREKKKIEIFSIAFIDGLSALNLRPQPSTFDLLRPRFSCLLFSHFRATLRALTNHQLRTQKHIHKQKTKKQRRVRRRSFLKKTPEQQAASAVRRGELPRVLGRADLYLLSLGSVVGAGCFVLTGVAAKDHAGPSVALAYLFSAGAALLSAVCYLEFAVESPRAGGAFSYVSVVGGELPAWIVASNLILEYSLSIAAVARAATAYACTLVGASSPSATLIKIGTAKTKNPSSSSSDPSSSDPSSSSSPQPLIELDPLAAAGILAITALLASGTAATARFNAVVTLVNLIAIFYIVLAAAPLAEASNLRPFAPEGMRGVFAASSVVFFAFVGFDTVATAAEDALDPTADLPVAIVGGLATAGALYALLALSLCAAVPRAAIDRTAPFSKLFLDHRDKLYGSSLAKHRLASALLATSSRFVGFGALSGLITAALVTVLGQARLLLVLGRERLLPASLRGAQRRRGSRTRHLDDGHLLCLPRSFLGSGRAREPGLDRDAVRFRVRGARAAEAEALAARARRGPPLHHSFDSFGPFQLLPLAQLRARRALVRGPGRLAAVVRLRREPLLAPAGLRALAGRVPDSGGSLDSSAGGVGRRPPHLVAADRRAPPLRRLAGAVAAAVRVLRREERGRGRRGGAGGGGVGRAERRRRFRSCWRRRRRRLQFRRGGESLQRARRGPGDGQGARRGGCRGQGAGQGCCSRCSSGGRRWREAAKTAAAAAAAAAAGAKKQQRFFRSRSGSRFERPSSPGELDDDDDHELEDDRRRQHAAAVAARRAALVRGPLALADGRCSNDDDDDGDDDGVGVFVAGFFFCCFCCFRFRFLLCFRPRYLLSELAGSALSSSRPPFGRSLSQGEQRRAKEQARRRKKLKFQKKTKLFFLVFFFYNL